MVCRNLQRRRSHRVTRWSIVERPTRVQTKINLFYLASHISMHRPVTGGFDRLEGRWPKTSPTRKCHKGLDLMNHYHGTFIQMIESLTWPTGSPTRGMRTTDSNEPVLMAPLVWQLGSWYIPSAEPNPPLFFPGSIKRSSITRLHHLLHLALACSLWPRTPCPPRPP
jgi:hypothetical protein